MELCAECYMPIMSVLRASGAGYIWLHIEPSPGCTAMPKSALNF